MNDLIIDVYMDTMCPWCRMGTSSLLTALKQLPKDKMATVRWFVLKAKIIGRL
ncbi:MAG: DsbA family oxidoreductase [Paenibacillus sp.]|nr:DsbA family oxidoreductase [Paenibacillus sp.]